MPAVSQSDHTILKSKMQAALVADEVLIQLGENMHMYIGTIAKPNIRFNLKGNAMYVYHRQLSMSTCTYTKEPRHTLQFPQVQVYLRIYIKRKPYTHICCILDYLNACVLQKRAWPNSINSSKYIKLR
jgi:hypothetical protein